MRRVLPPALEAGNLGDDAMLTVAQARVPDGEIAAIGADTVDGCYGRLYWWNEPVIHRVFNFSWSERPLGEAIRVFRRLDKAGTKFICRDQYSRQRCREATGVSCDCGADVSFLSPIRKPQVRRDEPFVVVVVRSDADISSLQASLRRLPVKTVAISHDRRKKVADDSAALRLRQQLACEAVLPVSYLDACELYLQAEMVFSYRMHGCLLALRCGCPAALLREYRDKARGQFSYFDLEDLVFPSESLGIRAIPDLWERRREIREQVRIRLPAVQRSAQRHFA